MSSVVPLGRFEVFALWAGSKRRQNLITARSASALHGEAGPGNDGHEVDVVSYARLQIGQAFGSYRILAKVGQGGMGEVYRARDTRLGRDVALKILAGAYANQRIRRFRQEATAASALNHPGILTIHEAGDADGCQFIATEFVDGETLREEDPESARPGAAERGARHCGAGRGGAGCRT